VVLTLAANKPQDLAHLSIEAIVSAGKSGDRLSQTILTEAADHLGTALAAIINLFSPEKIILGGSVPQVAADLLLDTVRSSLRWRTFQGSISNVDVVISNLSENATALGAVVMFAQELLEKLALPKRKGQ